MEHTLGAVRWKHRPVPKRAHQGWLLYQLSNAVCGAERTLPWGASESANFKIHGADPRRPAWCASPPSLHGAPVRVDASNGGIPIRPGVSTHCSDDYPLRTWRMTLRSETATAGCWSSHTWEGRRLNGGGLLLRFTRRSDNRHSLYEHCPSHLKGLHLRARHATIGSVTGRRHESCRRAR